MYDLNSLNKTKIIENIKEISDKIKDNNQSNDCSIKTKLMYEQLLRGLYLQLFP